MMFERVEFMLNRELRGWKIRRLAACTFEISPNVSAFIAELRRIAHVFRPARMKSHDSSGVR